MAFRSNNYPTLAPVMKNFPKLYVRKSFFIAKKIQLQAKQKSCSLLSFVRTGLDLRFVSEIW